MKYNMICIVCVYYIILDGPEKQAIGAEIKTPGVVYNKYRHGLGLRDGGKVEDFL